MPKKFALFLVGLHALVFAVTIAPAATGAFPTADIPHETYVLPNGLTLIVHEDHRSPQVALAVWYHAGSKNERPGRTGAAHLYEHLMFNGSGHYDRDYHAELERMGAVGTNGTTSRDFTRYFQNVPVAALDRALWLESDRMGYLLDALDQGKLDEQRGVVQNEKRNRENEPYGKVDEVIAAATYPPGHPHAWTTLGSMADLNATTLDDLREWGRSHYGASNAVLVVAGNVQPAEVRRKVEHYFADIPAGPTIERPRQWIAKMSGERRASMVDRAAQARIYKVWNVPGYATRDFTLLGMAADVLAGSRNAPLQRRLVQDRELLSDIEAGVGNFAIDTPVEIGSQFQIIATVAPGMDSGAAEKALDAELAHFLAEGPTEEQLALVRTQTYSKFVRALQSIDGYNGKAGILAKNHILAGDSGFFRTQLQWLREATPAEVREVARRWLADGVFVLNVASRLEYQVAPGSVDRREPPEARVEPRFDLPQPRRTTLSNGIDVVLVESHGAPVVEVRVLLDAGIAADSSATSGTMRTVLDMLMEGTGKRNAAQIAARAEALGAQLRTGSSFDATWLTLNALAEKLPESLELFSDLLLDPSLPQASFDRIKARARARIRAELADRRGLGSRLLPELIFGAGHPYAQPESGTEQSIASLQRSELQTFVRRWVRPDNATILVVGDTQGAAVTALLERFFGGWRVPTVPRAIKTPSAVDMQTRPRVFLIDRPGMDQSMVFAAASGPSLSGADRAAADIANWILGGTFSSRLNMNLREDKRWTYGASSEWIGMRAASMFVARSSVQTEHTAAAMREMLIELRRLNAATPPDETEFRTAVDSRIQALAGSIATMSDLAGLYAEPLLLGLPDDYWSRQVQAMKSLTAQSVGRAAAHLYQPEALTWLVIGDLRRVEQEIRQLGWGEVRLLKSDVTPPGGK